MSRPLRDVDLAFSPLQFHHATSLEVSRPGSMVGLASSPAAPNAHLIFDEPTSVPGSPQSDYGSYNGSGHGRQHHRTKVIHAEDGRKVSLYKTELCRSYEETNYCRYGSKCQFAHGKEELRQIQRHPRYKTEICKTFHTIGTCPYGKRCRFIHMDGLPRYWSASSPLNYLLFQACDPESGDSMNDADIDEYFASLDRDEPLPSTPAALCQVIQSRGRNLSDTSSISSISDEELESVVPTAPWVPATGDHLRRLPIFQMLVERNGTSTKARLSFYEPK